MISAGRNITTKPRLWDGRQATKDPVGADPRVSKDLRQRPAPANHPFRCIYAVLRKKAKKQRQKGNFSHRPAPSNKIALRFYKRRLRRLKNLISVTVDKSSHYWRCSRSLPIFGQINIDLYLAPARALHFLCAAKKLSRSAGKSGAQGALSFMSGVAVAKPDGSFSFGEERK
jgi:hypothetical protein